MNLPTLQLVIYWNSPDDVPNQLFLPNNFVSFRFIFISHEREKALL